MPVIMGCLGRVRVASSAVTRRTSTLGSVSGPMRKGMATAALPMTGAMDTARVEPMSAAILRRPSIPRGSDLQHFSVGSGFKLARVHRHREHAVIADGPRQLDEPLIAESLAD